MPEEATQSRIMMAISEPALAFEKLAAAEISASEIFFRYSIWLLLLPPVFLFIGGSEPDPVLQNADSIDEI